MDRRIKRLLGLLLCLMLLVPVAVGHGAAGAYATEAGTAVSEAPAPEASEAPIPETDETPAPEVSETPIPETGETPVPETGEAPVPEMDETPAPEVSETPIQQTGETPAPEVSETPVPEADETPIPEAGETPAPAVSETPIPEADGPAALYEALLAAATREEAAALLSGLDAAGAEAFAAALSGAQREALLAHFTALRGTPPAQRTVPFTHAGPLLPPVRVAAAALRRAARSDGGEQSNLKLGKTVRSNGDGTYTITLEAYTTGEVIDTTHTMPVDVVLVLDQSGSMADPFGSTTRQAAMKSAVNGFIDAVHEKYAPEADHRIALVTFGSNASTLRGWTSADDAGRNALRAAVDGLPRSPSGATNVAAGMTQAAALMDGGYGYTGPNTLRQQVVIVFTDGVPTTQSDFDTGVANRALTAARGLKQDGVTVYTIGIFEGAQADQLHGDAWDYAIYDDVPCSGEPGSYWGGSWAAGLFGSNDFDAMDVPAGNRFLNYLSTNFANSSAIGITRGSYNPGGHILGGGTGWRIDKNETRTDTGYYLTASNAGELENIFQSIGGQIATPGIELGSETVVRDVLSDYFVLPAGAGPDDIRLYTAAYDGTAFGAREAAQGLRAAVDAAAGTVAVDGFDFNANFVSDVPREGGFYGRKLIMEFTVQPRAGFLGGNGVPTNAAASGVYAGGGAAEPVGAFPVPTADVPIPAIVVTAEPADVYLFGGLTQEQLLARAAAQAGGVSLDLAAENFGLEPWQTAYVALTAAAGPAGGLAGLTEDGVYTVTAAIAPRASGAAQRSEGSAEAAVRVFRPELTFADSTIYLGETADYAQNLVSAAWKHGDEAANEAAMGAPPQLTLAYEPGAAAFRQDTDVSAAVSIGGRDATAYTTMVNTGGGAADHQFTVFVKACSLTITKTGAAQQSDSFLFDVTDEAGAVRTVAVHGNGSVTICGLPVGTYTVCERESWSWRYEGGRTARAALTHEAPSAAVTIENRVNNGFWLGGDSYQTNAYSGGE